MDIALSKQLCAKPISYTLWRLDDVTDHWDSLQLKSFATIEGERVLYQDGTLKMIRTPSDLIASHQGNLAPGTIMYGGTFGAIGGIRPGTRFEMELQDPVLERTMTHAYDIRSLPIVS